MKRTALLCLSVAALLASIPVARGDEAKKLRTDLYGDPLPPGAVARFGTVRLRHAYALFLFTQDGKRILSCDGQGHVLTWDVATGTRIRRRHLAAKTHEEESLYFCDVAVAGKIVAMGEKGIYLYAIPTGKETGRIAVTSERRSDLLVKLSPDGKLLALQKSGKDRDPVLELWDAGVVRKRQTLPLPAGVKLSSAVFSWDGKRLLGLAEKYDDSGPLVRYRVNLFLWDTAAGKLLRTRKDLRRVDAEAAAFSPDGERVTVWLGERMGIADVSTGSLLAKLPKEGVGWSPVFSPDGRLLLTVLRPRKEDGVAEEGCETRALIEAASGEEIRRLHWRAPNKVAFTPDSRAVIVSTLTKVQVWDTLTGEKVSQREWPDAVRQAMDRGGNAYISNLAALPGGRVAVSMTEGDILVWGVQPAAWSQPRPRRELDGKELASLWSDLAGDAPRAYRAIAQLSAAPTAAVALLQEHLRPPQDSKRLAQLLADLDSASFAARETASRELKRVPYRAAPMLRHSLQNNPSLELRRRIEPLLTEPRFPSREDLRALRAVAVLERIGTAEARRILVRLAGGTASPEMEAAQAALQRLKHRDAWIERKSSP